MMFETQHESHNVNHNVNLNVFSGALCFYLTYTEFDSNDSSDTFEIIRRAGRCRARKLMSFCLFFYFAAVMS